MIDVQKYHGTGNDFVVVDAAADVPDRRAFARVLCDRDTGIEHDDSPRRGADGVLFLALEDEYCPSRIVMTLVQPDGSVAPMCGNGARCAAAWAASETGCDEVMIDTQSGTRRATIDGDEVSIEMGAPTFEPAKVPVDADEPLIQQAVEGLTVTAVNTGVPHAVAFVDDVDDVALADVAPAVRYADVFPEGANVTLAAEDGDGYRQRTYERGVEGETDSCGTGAVAVAAVAHRLGSLEADQPVRVSPPGGDLEVTVSESGSTLRGPAVIEFSDQVDARPSPSAPADD
jgi:diaminopimelate epimerase